MKADILPQFFVKSLRCYWNWILAFSAATDSILQSMVAFIAIGCLGAYPRKDQ